MKQNVVLLALAALALTVSCAGGNKIVVASDATWPPMEMVDASKKMVGFDIDLMNAVAEAGNFKIQMKNTQWDGIFAGLAADKYDAVISSVTITEERKATLDFSEPYLNAGQVIVVRKETTGLTKIDDFKGKTMGAQIGTTGAMEIAKNKAVKLKNYDEVGMAIADLANGRIDGVVADGPIAANFALQNKEYAAKLMIVGEPFTAEYFGIAVKKGNTELLAKINTGLAIVKTNGTLSNLVDKWLR